MQQLKILFFLLSIGLTTLVNGQNEGIQFDVSTQTFPGLEFSALDFGDIDGDGDEDFILTGSNGNSSNDAETYLYENQGNGFFVIVSGTPFERVSEGDVEFADIDNDGDLDLLIAGRNNSNDDILKMYENDGNGNFSVSVGAVNLGNGNYPSQYPTFKFGDLNNDQFIDLVYISSDHQLVLLNDGTGDLTMSSTISTESYNHSNIDIGDLDNDGDLDLGIVATTTTGTGKTTRIYLNNGASGSFIEEPISNLFDSYGTGQINFVDSDNDGDLDIVLYNIFNQANHFINESTFNNTIFTESTPLISFHKGNSLVFDFNEDGLNDLISIGDNTEDSVTILFNIPNANTYQYQPNYIYNVCEMVNDAEIDYSDIDNDGDLDLLISGRFFPNNSQTLDTRIYYNNSCPPVSYVDRRNLVCDSITWRGNHFNYGPPTESSESYYDTTYTVNGCDSAITFFPRFLSGMAQEVNPLHAFFDTGWVAVADNAVSVQWLDCNDNYAPVPGGDHLLFTPPSIGQYAITIDDGVCVDTSLCFNVYTLGTNSYLEENVKISPNPSSGIFTIETPLAAFQYQVYNMVGQTVLSGQATQSSIRLNLAQFERGVYILNLVAEGGQRLSYRLVRE